jgi:hypothetical protein
MDIRNAISGQISNVMAKLPRKSAKNDAVGSPAWCSFGANRRPWSTSWPGSAGLPVSGSGKAWVMRGQQLSEAQISALLDPPPDQRELVRHRGCPRRVGWGDGFCLARAARAGRTGNWTSPPPDRGATTPAPARPEARSAARRAPRLRCVHSSNALAARRDRGSGRARR